MAPDPADDSAASPVQASPAVTSLVGAETLARLRGEAFRRYACSICGQPGRTGAEPAAIIAQRYRLGAIRVRLAHARCADSQVLEASADAPDAAAFGGMLSTPAVLQYASGPPVRPLLVLEPQTALSERAAGGEQVNLWLSSLLGQSFTMLATGGEFPGPAPGWRLQLGLGAARLLAPDDTIAYQGGLAPPAAWLDLVRRGGACVILAGTIGLSAYLGDEMPVQNLRRLLNQAARSGELAGAVVRTET